MTKFWTTNKPSGHTASRLPYEIDLPEYLSAVFVGIDRDRERREVWSTDRFWRTNARLETFQVCSRSIKLKIFFAVDNLNIPPAWIDVVKLLQYVQNVLLSPLWSNALG